MHRIQYIEYVLNAWKIDMRFFAIICNPMIPYVYYTPFHKYHAAPHMHPEQPARISAIVNRLQTYMQRGLLELHEYKPPYIMDKILDMHERDNDPWTLEDGDTYKTHFTDSIVRATTEMIENAVDHLLEGETKCAFVLCRPPGHHASEKPAGFCIQNHAYTALQCIIARDNAAHVSIYDWDVHHGDGTEALLLQHADNIAYSHVRFVSTHAFGDDIYPGTGDRCYDRIRNVPLNRNTVSDTFLQVFDSRVLPYLTENRPSICIISAGYDGHKKDPMKLMLLTTDVYRIMAEKIKAIGCPVLFLLEGGYHPPTLVECVEATLQPFMNP